MEDFDFFGKVNQGLDFYKILGCDRSSTVNIKLQLAANA